MLLRTRTKTVLAACGLTIALAACGGDGDDDDGVASAAAAEGETAAQDTGSGSDTDATDEEQLLDYIDCLRGEGLDIEDPTVDADGNLRLAPPAGGQAAFDQEAFEAAQEVCGEPPAAVSAADPRNSTEFQDATLEFAQCMRDNGVDMPDPDFSQEMAGAPGSGTGDGSGGPFGELDTDDPDFDAAFETCQQVFADAGIALPGATG